MSVSCTETLLHKLERLNRCHQCYPNNLIAKLSKANEDYEEERKQNEEMIKNLNDDLLKLSKKSADLKYDQKSKNGSF